MKARSKRLVITGAIVLGLLMIPLIAMQFNSGVNWDITDFLIMGAVLFGMGLIYEFIPRNHAKKTYRWAFGTGLLGAFLLFWVNGAVGIIGGDSNPANMLFAAVFLVGIIGSLVSGLKARGMAITMYTTAAVQMLVPVVALIIYKPGEYSWSPGIFGVFLLTAFFALLFLISAMLFKKAA